MLSITLELLDKWGRHYETTASPNGMKIVEAWRELTKENVRFPHSPAEYAFLTKPSASRDAGAFGFGFGPSISNTSNISNSRPSAPSGAPSASGTEEELSEEVLQSLCAGVQSALAQHGHGSPEVAEAKAHFESTLAQWQHAAAEAVEKGDMAAYERLSEVAVRYAEQGNRLDSSHSQSPSISTEFSRTLSGVSPSPPDSDTMQESHTSSQKKHRRRKKEVQEIQDAFEVQPDVAMTPSFGHPQTSWEEAEAADAAAAYRSGEFGGSFGLGASFPSDPGNSDPFGAQPGTENYGGFGAAFPDPGLSQFGSASLLHLMSVMSAC